MLHMKLILSFLLLCSLAAAAQPSVSIVLSGSLGAPSRHGVMKLEEALTKKKVSFEEVFAPAAAKGKLSVVVGLSGSIAGPEGLSISKGVFGGRTVWTVNGSDDRGLMYALLDMADRIGWARSGIGDVFARVKPVNESADVKERAVVIYTMNKAYWESRFYDSVYWARYLDMMARDRLNMLEVGFGFENGGFLAPAYPYFFDIASFPDIHMGNITAAQQQRNLDAFNRLVRMCHDRGIGFRVGFWDHIYRGGFQSNKDMPEEPDVIVRGVTAENMIAYTKAGVAKFISLVPGLDGILFRAHDESGLKKSEQLEFWKGIFDTLAVVAPKLPVDLHAKEVSDTIVHEGQARGLTIRMSTKYWMEQMGLPFHPTHTNRITDNNYRRHGYGDMLNYNEHYPVFYRIWGGTTRVLLWGDPDYARRFAATTHIHDGAGFGVNEPLTTKMHAQRHDAIPFDLLKPAYRYYDYEFERYWHFYQTFGRLGYNPATPAEVWDEQFASHFGTEAGPIVERGLHSASWVLPRIVASCFPLFGFPIASGWAEKQHMGDLADYAKTTPSDVQQFASFDDEARLLIEKGETARLLPSRNSLWFRQRSEAIDALVAQVSVTGQGAGAAAGAKELASTLTDLRILSGLALYHSKRIPAAVEYCLYLRTHDRSALAAAITYEKDAMEAWKGIVTAAGDVYADTLMMGPRKRTLVGHWRQELQDIQAGIGKLEQQLAAYQSSDTTKTAPHYKAVTVLPVFKVTHQPVGSAKPGQPMVVILKVAGAKSVRLLYRDVNQYKEYVTLDMQPTKNKDEYTAIIPGSAISAQWDLQYLFEIMDNHHNGRIYPDMDQETPYVVVKTNQ